MRRPPHSGKRHQHDSHDLEEFRDFRRFMEEVNRKIPPWPRLNEDEVHEHSPPPTADPHRDSVRVVSWAIAFVLGAITIYGIAVGNETLLKGVLTASAAWMLRLIVRGRQG